MNALAPLLGCDRNALVDHLEYGIANDDVLIFDASRFRQLELSRVELLVTQDEMQALRPYRNILCG
jgi:hypothetical protein